MSEKIPFSKYHGNGNDFILIDNRNQLFNEDNERLVQKLCDRRFGIGADGLILLKDSDLYDFEMRYYNADGRESTLCGNGGRCIVKFAEHLGLIAERTEFLAIDGAHEAEIINEQVVKLKMHDVSQVSKVEGDYVLDTGSPHYVQFLEEVDSLDVFTRGKSIRNQVAFKTEGINVNFVSDEGDFIKVRTYERGVEDETYSCGTGVTAAAIAYAIKRGGVDGMVTVQAKGGPFKIHLDDEGGIYKNIWLEGPVAKVFHGHFHVADYD